MRDALANISTIIGILIEEGGEPLPAGELNGLPVLPSFVPVVFFSNASKGKMAASILRRPVPLTPRSLTCYDSVIQLLQTFS